jgi:iron(III) transport system permease protein
MAIASAAPRFARALPLLLLLLACAGPSAAVLWGGAAGLAAAPLDVGAPLFWSAVRGSVFLWVFGAGGAVVLGAGAALLVGCCRFPGSGLFDIALALPLAAPPYVLAYAYGALTGPGGVLEAAWSGQSKTALVYALAFYPYVFLAVRAGLVAQSASAVEAARSLGAGPWRTLRDIILPLLRPALAAGAALAAMEAAADYGAAAYFGADSLSVGVFRAWYALQAPALALQLASLLLLAALALLALERAARPRHGLGGAGERWRTPLRWRLGPGAAAAAAAACLGLLTAAFLLPVAWLLRLALLDAHAWERLLQPGLRSLLLAGLGATVTLALSLCAAAAIRRRDRLGRLAGDLASIGYAAPGAVLALGALSWLALGRELGLIAGLGAGGALALLVWAYAARFTAAGAQPIAAGLGRVSDRMGEAARTLGAGPLRRFFSLNLPIAAPSALAGALIVFVEVLKELPATLILRPFDWDTLAVRAHAYAADERLVQAAAPALAITLAGVAPILLLARRLAHARAGGGR